MQIQDDDLSNNVILEEIKDQNKAILEMLSGFREVPAKVNNIETVIEKIDTDNKSMKLVIKDHSRQLDDHETRITQLETV